jgi:hypothetical protein
VTIPAAAHHLAQLNIGRLRAPVDSPEIAEFVAGLDAINALAEASTGFVWRLQTDDGNATAVRAYDDELVIVNLSVWTSVQALAEFVFRSGHVEFLRRRREWFERGDAATTVLWWVPAGELPAIDRAVERLEHLRTHGPTPHAFTFRHPYAPDGEGTIVARPADDRDACPA